MEDNHVNASTEQYYEVTEVDLPLSCPMSGVKVWNLHPRVYLPIEKTGREICPYCGTEYVLKHLDE
ncbi:MAG: zinc-finger domain-containing protein [Gammaproteobacteria bacterium]